MKRESISPVDLPSKFVVASLVIVVILVYAWFANPAKSNEWESSTNYFDLLAKGFLSSNLYLSLEPEPKLLALPNPYDPLTREGIEMMWDLSLYQGKYYMYWGPVPALILSGIYLFFHGSIRDQFLVFAFISGLFIVQVLLLLTLWKQYFHRLPRLLLYISILLIGLAGPLNLLRHNYASAQVYEAAITGGQLFFMSGIFMALTSVAHSPISNWKLAIAAMLWALAIGTRQILAVPIGFMSLMLAFWFLQTNAWSFKKAMQSIPLALPLVFGFVGFGWYNWARFGSVTETGFYYALAGVNLQEHSHELFSPAYIIPNLYNYLFNSIELTTKFPFVVIPLGKESFSYFSVPDVYAAEPITGLFYIFPFALFAGLPFLVPSARKMFLSSLDANERNYWNWITQSLGGSFVITFSLLMLFFWAGARYIEDFLPSLMVLSIIGFWMGFQSLRPQTLRRKLYSIFGITLAGTSILINTLLAISTNHELVKLIIGHVPFP